MEERELLQRLANHEDQFIERKQQGVSREDIQKAVVAFANSVQEGHSAILFIGVSDEGVASGIDNVDGRVRDVGRWVEDWCYPRIEIQIQVFRKDEDPIIAVIVPFSRNKPHFAGPAYIRQGATSRKASEEQFNELILDRTDKTRELRRLVGQQITLEAVGKRMGQNRPMAAGYQENCDGRIDSLDAHVVRFTNIGNMSTFSEPVENVTIAYDDHRARPKILLRPAR